MKKTSERNNLLKDTLKAFLDNFDELDAQEKELIIEKLKVDFFEKGTLLVRQGQLCNHCYFVLKGCLRQYVIIEGNEKTTQFYTARQAAVFFSSYAKQSPTDNYLTCTEDSVLIIGQIDQEKEMYQLFPKLAVITRRMMEEELGKTQDALAYFMTSTPEERYLHLLKNRPELLQKVPHHQLASYIGITPESFSRIRKRIQKS